MQGKVAKRGNVGKTARLMWGKPLRDRFVVYMLRGEEDRLRLGVGSLGTCLY